MTNWLLKIFVKNYQDVESIPVRTKYGVLASIIGVICNLTLFAIKFTIGTLIRSVAITADGFNNLSDAGSNIVSVIGVKMAAKPADKEHPFGHGRLEYVTSLIIALIIIQVGFGFLQESIGRIQNPEDIVFSAVSIVVLILSLVIKGWYGFFNRNLGRRINSTVMKAVFTDSMSDLLVTSATILSLVIFAATGWNVDGYIGILVALAVMWSGVSIARDTIEPLIGEGIDPELYSSIKKFVQKYPGVIGTHGLIVHSYGPSRRLASIHIEIADTTTLEAAHTLASKIESAAMRDLELMLVIHVEPFETDDNRMLAFRNLIEKHLKELDLNCSFHDLWIKEDDEGITINIDLELPSEYSHKKGMEIEESLAKKMAEENPRFRLKINANYSFKAIDEE